MDQATFREGHCSELVICIMNERNMYIVIITIMKNLMEKKSKAQVGGWGGGDFKLLIFTISSFQALLIIILNKHSVTAGLTCFVLFFLFFCFCFLGLTFLSSFASDKTRCSVRSVSSWILTSHQWQRVTSGQSPVSKTTVLVTCCSTKLGKSMPYLHLHKPVTLRVWYAWPPCSGYRVIGIVPL